MKDDAWLSLKRLSLEEKLWDTLRCYTYSSNLEHHQQNKYCNRWQLH